MYFASPNTRVWPTDLGRYGPPLGPVFCPYHHTLARAWCSAMLITRPRPPVPVPSSASRALCTALKTLFEHFGGARLGSVWSNSPHNSIYRASSKCGTALGILCLGANESSSLLPLFASIAPTRVKPKRTKATDMRFHWLRDRECQEQFRIYWRPGKLNYADY